MWSARAPRSNSELSVTPRVWPRCWQSLASPRSAPDGERRRARSRRRDRSSLRKHPFQRFCRWVCIATEQRPIQWLERDCPSRDRVGREQATGHKFTCETRPKKHLGSTLACTGSLFGSATVQQQLRGVHPLRPQIAAGQFGNGRGHDSEYPEPTNQIERRRLTGPPSVALSASFFVSVGGRRLGHRICLADPLVTRFLARPAARARLHG